MSLKDLENYAKDFIKNNPEHSEEVEDLYQLCIDEIEAGASMENEIQLCISDIKQILE